MPEEINRVSTDQIAALFPAFWDSEAAERIASVFRERFSPQVTFQVTRTDGLGTSGLPRLSEKLTKKPQRVVP